MDKIIALLVGLSMAACYSNANEISRLRDENRRLRAAQSDGWRPSGHPAIPTQAPAAPGLVGQGVVGNVPGVVGGVVTNAGQVATAAAVVRQQPSAYICALGAQPRQVTMGRKVELRNVFCDPGSRDMGNCLDVDMNGAEDYNSFESFQINGRPVIIDGPYLHPQSRESLLPPGQSCFIDMGRTLVFNLGIKVYRNTGTPTSIMLDPAPDMSTTKVVDIRTLTRGLYEVGEGRFWPGSP